MLPPIGAFFETELSRRVVLYDVSKILPTGAGHYRTRSVPGIDRVYVHKSGADGLPGFAGCYAMAHYTTAPPPPKGHGRGWPGAPYHFWISRTCDQDSEGRWVVYRCQGDGVWSNHSGQYANERGIAIALQGNYDSEWDLLSSGRPRIMREPSDAQLTCLEALVDWAVEKYRLKLPDGLSGHWEAPHPKRVCPGDFLRQWVIDRRGAPSDHVDNGTVAIPVADATEIDVAHPTPRTLQKAIAALGYDPGPLDGIWGYRSRAALEQFQREAGLDADGWYGPLTARALLQALRDRGLSRLDVEGV